MANGIVYNSEEVFATQKVLQESIDLLKSEIEGQVSSEFAVLEDLDLFYDGMDSLKKQMKELNDKNDKLYKELEAHDQEMNELEESQERFIHDFIREKEKNSSYNGEYININSIDIGKVNNGKKLSGNKLSQIIADISYKDIVTILKDILKDQKMDIITDKEKYSILVTKLNQILKSSGYIDEDIDMGEDLQKELLGYIANNKEISDEFKNTFIESLPYLKEYASDNNIDLYDLITDDSNNEKLMEAYKDLYLGNNTGGLSSDTIISINSYLENVAKENNISINALLANSSNVSLIKGGI